METVLILGGFGFLGSNLLYYASQNLSNQYRFIIFDIYDQHPLNENFPNVIKIYKGDFTNKEDLNIIFKENKIDYVFHLISTTVPANSNNNIRYDIESNLISTINLLDICKHHPLKNFLFISSGGTVYGNSENYIHKEDDALSPISSYGVIKITIEKYLQLYNHLYKLNYICLRLSNPYGLFHRSKKQGIINIAIKKAISNEKFEVWGDGSNLKDYIYAEDVARIIFILLKRAITNKILNIGSGQGHSINEILGIIKTIMPSFIITHREQKSFDVPKIVLNTDAVTPYIDFKLTSLENGIYNTYRWTLDNKSQ